MNFRAAALATVVYGAVINGCEWLFHGVLLDSAWTKAFAALGKTPTGWSIFIPSNFILAFVSVVIYDRVRRIGKPLRSAVAVTALAVWLIFWVIPTMAMLPLNLFPPALLWSVIGLGMIDCSLAILLLAALYRPADKAPLH
jgi:hypothetical protein